MDLYLRQLDNKKKTFFLQQKLINLHKLTINERYSLIFACIFLFLIGASLGAIIRKGGLGLPLVLSIVIFLTYHYIGVFGKNAAEDNSLSPFIGSWISTFIIAPFAIYFTKIVSMDRGFNFSFFDRLYLILKILELRMNKIKLDKIEDAIKSINNGEIIIVVDDENRENEGDFITAAETINSDKINFMAKHGRGLICVPMSENLCAKLNLEKMVPNNTDPLETAFTVSVDLKGNGVTSGISASDRSKTVQALVDSNTKPDDLQRPGHVFPLIAKRWWCTKKNWPY